MTDRSRGCAGSKMEPDLRFVRPELSDEQWAVVGDLFRSPKPSPQAGRPRTDARACLECVLWLLRSGARWKDLPPWFPSYATCWRRFVERTTDGTLEKVHRWRIGLLDQAGQIDWEEGFADGTFVPAKKGAIASA